MNFQQWLIQIGKSDKTAKNYSQAIESSISQWAQDAGLIESKLIEVQNLTKLNAVIDDIQRLDIFQQRNSKGNGMYSAALKQFAQYIDDVTGQTVVDDIEQIISDDSIASTEKSTLINTRIGQGKFRDNLISYWQGCAVTRYPDHRFLVASHIKPWKDSDNKERLDVNNGLLLLPNIDKVFDLGFISFSNKGKILISNWLDSPETLNLNEAMHINLKQTHQPYMQYHREEVFEKRNG